MTITSTAHETIPRHHWVYKFLLLDIGFHSPENSSSNYFSVQAALVPDVSNLWGAETCFARIGHLKYYFLRSCGSDSNQEAMPLAFIQDRVSVRHFVLQVVPLPSGLCTIISSVHKLSGMTVSQALESIVSSVSFHSILLMLASAPHFHQTHWF